MIFYTAQVQDIHDVRDQSTRTAKQLQRQLNM